ncbi:hypothetical protein [Cellulosimicrobium sp. SL-1]|uniref:hypothetical protein n=1 Tax=Cellulosimicrobium sp. SL-1 TaxID=2699423 RepID=UPI0013D87634|nr:hypothetical protein [Cellulosimicrobium sp. SL-1]
MTGPTTPPLRLTKAELDALPLYAAVLCVDQKYRRVYLALKVGNPPGTGGHTWRTTDYSTIPDSGRLAADYALLLDPGLTAVLLMGFAQDAALAATSTKADALTEPDQASNVVHVRREPDVVHSRHHAPRDIPSPSVGPATTPALARADATYRAHRVVVDEDGAAPSCAGCEFVTPLAADGQWDHPAFHRHRIAATVYAALRDPDDPDALAREYVARLAHESWDTGCQRVCFHATWDDMTELDRNVVRAQLAAMTSTVLGRSS